MSNSVSITSKAFISSEDPAFHEQTGWSVHADIRIGGNTYSGPHFCPDLPEDADDDAIKAAILKQYGA